MSDLERLLQLAGIGSIDKAGYEPYVAEKKADKDYDEDGEIEDQDDEWKGSRDNAIKDEKCDESLESDEQEIEADEEFSESDSLEVDDDVEQIEEEDIEEGCNEVAQMRRLAGLEENGEDAMDFAVSMDDPDAFAAGDGVASEGGTMVFNNSADAIEAAGELEAYGISAEMVGSRPGTYRLSVDAPQDVINDIAQKWEGATVEGCGGIDDTQPSMGGMMGGGEPEMVVIQLDDGPLGEGMGDLDLIAQEVANELAQIVQQDPDADDRTAVYQLVKSNPDVPEEMKGQVASMALDYYENGMVEDLGEGMGDLDLIAQEVASKIGQLMQQDPDADDRTAAYQLVKSDPEVPEEMKGQVASMALDYYENGMAEGLGEGPGDEEWGPADHDFIQGNREPEQPEWDPAAQAVGGAGDSELGALDPAELIQQITLMQDSGMSAANAYYDPDRLLQMPIDRVVSVHQKVMGETIDEEDENWGGDAGYQTEHPGGHVPYDAEDLFPSGQATNAIHRVSNTAGGHSDNPMATVDPVVKKESVQEIHDKLKESLEEFKKKEIVEAPRYRTGRYGQGYDDGKAAFKSREMDAELGHEKNGPPIKLAVKIPFNLKDKAKDAARKAGVKLGWNNAQKTWFVQVGPTQDVLGAVSRLEQALGQKIR